LAPPVESVRAKEAELLGKKYTYIIETGLSWSVWADPKPVASYGDEVNGSLVSNDPN
jgi:hypothetical protein